ncbi:MAG: hypothetical protein HY695_06110 [Deltaproteobacteria bacterium]|nr:hypothetical protein [Deltaproteobacteria bacterium]
MKARGIILLAIVATLFSFSAGCVVAERSGGHGRYETYYYYPDYEVYFYPSARVYYWLDRGDWRHGPQPPPRYALEPRGRVKLDLDYEPHTRHARIRDRYPPGRYEDRDQDRDRRDRDRRDKDR